MEPISISQVGEGQGDKEATTNSPKALALKEHRLSVAVVFTKRGSGTQRPPSTEGAFFLFRYIA